MITKIAQHSFWTSHALLIARIFMGGLFLFSAYTKFTGIDAVAGYIASVGLPAPLALAWLAAFFEAGFGLALVAGVYFTESALLLAAFVVFLAVVFHGPSRWGADPGEFGSFVNHLALIAGLLYMTAHGPGNTWTLKGAEWGR